MKCQVAQKKITEGFAAGLATLSSDVHAHLKSCEKCKRFYEKEKTLLLALDRELQNLVNRRVPTSLLPRVRAGLEQTAARPALGAAGWSLVALSAAMALAVCLGSLLNRAPRYTTEVERQPLVSQAAHPPTPKPPSPSRAAAANPAALVEAPRASHVKTSIAGREVLVLAEERDAFARFVVHRVPNQIETGVTASSSEQSDAPLEIALLQIEKVQIEPLKGTARQ